METALAIVLFPSLAVVLFHLCVRTQPEEERQWLWRLLLLAAFVRMGAVTAFDLAPDLRLFHADTDGCEIRGLAIARDWRGDGPPLPLSARDQNLGFLYVCGAIYFTLGTHVPNAAYVVALISSLTIFFVYLLAKRFFHFRVARFAALLTAFMPSLLAYGSMAVKEPLVLMLLVIAISAAIALTRGPTLWRVVGVIVPTLALQPLRFYVVYFLVLAILASVVLDRRYGAINRTLKAGGIGIALLAALVISGLTARAEAGLEIFSFRGLGSMREAAVVAGNSGYAPEADVSTPAGAAAFLPLGVATLLLGPFPWQLNSLRQLVALPEMAFWWFLVPSIVRGVRFAAKHCARALAPLFWFCALLTVVYSVGQGEMGTAMRQRGQIFIFLFVFAALGRYQMRCRRSGVPEELLIRDVEGGFGLGPKVVSAAGAAANAQALQKAVPTQIAPAPEQHPGRVGRCRVCRGIGKMNLHFSLGGSDRPCIVCRGKGWLVFAVLDEPPEPAKDAMKEVATADAPATPPEAKPAG